MAVHLDERDPHLDPRDAAAEDEHEPAHTGGHLPPMDILEHPTHLEIRLDLAGTHAADIHITIAGNQLRIAGHKRPPCPCAPGAAAFHVAERTFGHFARTVALRHAFDAHAIKATLAHGELRILVPRRDERRGRPIEIPIETL